jgi:formylmethanofuran dehydrogenase subunit E
MLDPLLAHYPKLPSNKYGKFICDVCNEKWAERWEEITMKKFCFDCAIKKIDNY